MMADKDVPAFSDKALKLRAKLKSKKPKFARSESWKYIRLSKSWRRPRGLDNKMRRKIKGWPPTVSTGYRGPKATRGLHPSGYKEILVYTIEELKKVDPETQAVRIAHAVGKRRRTEILAEARKKGITILNIKEIKEKPREVSEEAEAKEETAEEEEKPETEAEEVKPEKEKPKKPPKKKRKEKAERQ